jgi:hypothetical protein
MANRHIGLALALLCWCMTADAQSHPPPEDPEDEKRLGLWLDQGISAGIFGKQSLELEFHERFDNRARDLFDYFAQAGLGFRPRRWLTIIPSYRYERFPGNPAVAYENRLLLNITLSKSRGRWLANLRTQTEGRFPDNRPASARLRFRPGLEYTLPVPIKRLPVLVATNEFFVVPGTNSFSAGGHFTQNRFQAGVRLPITAYLSVRPYFLLQSVNLPTHWETNGIVGISLTSRF